jgi:hypothetical protein
VGGCSLLLSSGGLIGQGASKVVQSHHKVGFQFQ